MQCVNCGCSPTELSKARAFNRAAFLASASVPLIDQIKVWEKDARRTPPKTLKAEWEKVRAAKEKAEKGRIQLEEMKAEIRDLFPLSQWWPELLMGSRPI